MATASAICSVCDRRVMAEKPEASHLIHAFITLFTCGFWAIVWAIAGLNAGSAPWRCTQCGSPVKPS